MDTLRLALSKMKDSLKNKAQKNNIAVEQYLFEQIDTQTTQQQAVELSLQHANQQHHPWLKHQFSELVREIAAKKYDLFDKFCRQNNIKDNDVYSKAQKAIERCLFLTKEQEILEQLKSHMDCKSAMQLTLKIVDWDQKMKTTPEKKMNQLPVRMATEMSGCPSNKSFVMEPSVFDTDSKQSHVAQKIMISQLFTKLKIIESEEILKNMLSAMVNRQQILFKDTCSDYYPDSVVQNAIYEQFSLTGQGLVTGTLSIPEYLGRNQSSKIKIYILINMRDLKFDVIDLTQEPMRRVKTLLKLYRSDGSAHSISWFCYKNHMMLLQYTMVGVSNVDLFWLQMEDPAKPYKSSRFSIDTASNCRYYFIMQLGMNQMTSIYEPGIDIAEQLMAICSLFRFDQTFLEMVEYLHTHPDLSRSIFAKFNRPKMNYETVKYQQLSSNRYVHYIIAWMIDRFSGSVPEIFGKDLPIYSFLLQGTPEENPSPSLRYYSNIFGIVHLLLSYKYRQGQFGTDFNSFIDRYPKVNLDYLIGLLHFDNQHETKKLHGLNITKLTDCIKMHWFSTLKYVYGLSVCISYRSFQEELDIFNQFVDLLQVMEDCENEQKKYICRDAYYNQTYIELARLELSSIYRMSPPFKGLAIFDYFKRLSELPTEYCQMFSFMNFSQELSHLFTSTYRIKTQTKIHIEDEEPERSDEIQEMLALMSDIFLSRRENLISQQGYSNITQSFFEAFTSRLVGQIHSGRTERYLTMLVEDILYPIIISDDYDNAKNTIYSCMCNLISKLQIRLYELIKLLDSPLKKNPQYGLPANIQQMTQFFQGVFDGLFSMQSYNMAQDLGNREWHEIVSCQSMLRLYLLEDIRKRIQCLRQNDITSTTSLERKFIESIILQDSIEKAARQALIRSLLNVSPEISEEQLFYVLINRPQKLYQFRLLLKNGYEQTAEKIDQVAQDIKNRIDGAKLSVRELQTLLQHSEDVWTEIGEIFDRDGDELRKIRKIALKINLKWHSLLSSLQKGIKICQTFSDQVDSVNQMAQTMKNRCSLLTSEDQPELDVRVDRDMQLIFKIEQPMETYYMTPSLFDNQLSLERDMSIEQFTEHTKNCIQKVMSTVGGLWQGNI